MRMREGVGGGWLERGIWRSSRRRVIVERIVI